MEKNNSLESSDLATPRYRLVFRHPDFLVVEKPAGLVVHPKENRPGEVPDFSNTLAGQLLEDFPSIGSVGEKAFRPGIVHRLDKETSGLMVVALNQTSFQFFKQAFSQRKMEKKYWALAWGEPKKESGEIRSLIGRSHNHPDRQAAVFSPAKAGNVKAAASFFQVLKKQSGMSLWEVAPQTGRKHQIRVHLHLMGHPVVGDKKYQTKTLKKKNVLFGRHFLHAFFLRFVFSDGKEYSFKSDWPPDFQAVFPLDPRSGFGLTGGDF